MMNVEQRKKNMRKRVREEMEITNQFVNSASFNVNTQVRDVERYYQNKALRGPNVMMNYTKTETILGTSKRQIKERLRRLQRDFVKVISPYSTVPYAFVPDYKSYMRRQSFLLKKWLKAKKSANKLGDTTSHADVVNNPTARANSLVATESETELIAKAMVS